MGSQVSVTAAFQSCGKQESAISTNTHPSLLSCSRQSIVILISFSPGKLSGTETNIEVVGAFGPGASEFKIQRPFQTNLSLQT